MSFGGVELVSLEVNSLEESLDFYVERLGFSVLAAHLRADPPSATLRAGTLTLALAQRIETLLKRGRGVTIFVTVGDVDALHAKLVGKGVAVPEPADEGWGGRFIVIEDPDSYRFFFVTWHDRAISLQA